MNRIIENANAFDAKLATLEDGEGRAIADKLVLEVGEIFAFKHAISLGQLEGRITLEEAETLQHAITMAGWREGTSPGMRAACYLACAELVGLDVERLARSQTYDA